MKTNGIPKIRFKGFTDDWEQRKLGEIAEFNPKSDLPDEFEYVDLESVVGTEMVFHRTENKASAPSRAQRVAKTGDVFFQTVRPYQRNNYLFSMPYENYVFSTGYAQMRPKINAAFLMCFLQTESFVQNVLDNCTGTSYPAINSSDLSNLKISLPILKSEQSKIGELISNLDHLITLHQRKCEQTKELKKFMLQKMFPKKGEKNPEIRFPGFTDDWEQRKLSELYNKNTEKNEELISYDKTISIATMTYKNGGNGASDKSLKAYKVLRVGDLAFEGHTNKKFKYGRFVLNDIGTGIMSPRFSTLRPIQCMPISFWKYYIHYEPIMQKILVNSTKAGTMMNELVIPEFLKQSILVPSMNEQKKIGEYFSNLDHLITLHQRKCEQLKELKKFMLQNMFPKKG